MNKKEKLLDKCKKLLAVSKDKSSLEEAAIALRQLNKLMTKHKLEFNDLKENEYITVPLKVRSKAQWHELVLSKIAELYFCVATIERTTKQFILFGKRLDIEICSRVTDYVVKCIISQSNLLCVNNPNLKKKDVREGMGIGVYEKINSILAEEEGGFSFDEKTSDNKNLIVAMRKDELSKIESFIHNLDGINFKNERQWKEKTYDGESVNIGFEKGQKINVRGEQLETHDN